MKLNTIALPMPRHGRKPRQSRTPAQCQQNRFDLIISMLGQCQGSWPCRMFVFPRGPALNGKLCKRSVARASGGIFRALASLTNNVNPANNEWHVQLSTHLLALALKIVSRRLEAMMNVNSSYLPWPFLMARQQQCR